MASCLAFLRGTKNLVDPREVLGQGRPPDTGLDRGLLCASTSEDGGVWIDKEPAGTARLERPGQPTTFPAVGHAATSPPWPPTSWEAETLQVQVVNGAEDDVIWFLKLHLLPFTAAQGIDWPGWAMTTRTGARVATLNDLRTQLAELSRWDFDSAFRDGVTWGDHALSLQRFQPSPHRTGPGPRHVFPPVDARAAGSSIRGWSWADSRCSR